uniref:Uncharacterized protein n=1 Tax=Trichuris muris TaxID=70415 RepID=A0A5S6R4N2_TRIMR
MNYRNECVMYRGCALTMLKFGKTFERASRSRATSSISMLKAQLLNDLMHHAWLAILFHSSVAAKLGQTGD